MTPAQEARLRHVIGEHLGVDVGSVTDDKRLVLDLCADSLDTIEIVMALEEEFDIRITDEELELLPEAYVLTVGHVVEFLRTRV